MLCDYGCGKQSNYIFSNGKHCCSNHYSQCPSMKELRKKENLSKETRKKMSDSTKGIKNPMFGKHRSISTREKISKATTGIKRTSVFKNKLKIIKRKEYLSKETRYKMSESSKGNIPGNKLTISKIKKKFPTFAKIEEMRYEPGKEKERIIQVHCKNHNCENSKEKNGWFTVKNTSQLMYRIYAIEKDEGNYYYYCSDECRQSCPLFKKTITQIINQDQIKAGLIEDPWYNSQEYQTWRQQVFELDNSTCQYCGEPATVAHHILPQKTHPNLALDPENGISCCQECHFKYGHRDRWCTIGYLNQLVCKRNIR